MKLIIDIPDEVLKSRHYCRYFGAWSTKLTETIENGIPVNTDGDTISRSALKKEMDNLFKNGGFDSGLVLDKIDNAPPVETFTKDDVAGAYNEGYACGNRESERPKGEWIVLVDADNIQTCKCSICGRIADIANREFDKFPYCHCGAKMKGGADMRGEKE